MNKFYAVMFYAIKYAFESIKLYQNIYLMKALEFRTQLGLKL